MVVRHEIRELGIHSFITKIFIAPLQRLPFRSAPDLSTAKEHSFKVRVDAWEWTWEAVAVPMEAHSMQKAQICQT